MWDINSFIPKRFQAEFISNKCIDVVFMIMLMVALTQETTKHKIIQKELGQTKQWNQ